MRLYLIQHGKAKKEEEDPNRPLTDEGKNETEKVAKKFMDRGYKVDVIYTSKKLRAKQTAQILAKKINPAKGIIETDGLNPDDDPMILEKRINKLNNKNVMIVGHLPHLEKFTALILHKENPIKFVNSWIFCFEFNNNWKLIDKIMP